MLVLSYMFYAFWNLGAVPILFISTLINFVLAEKMPTLPTKQQKKVCLVALVTINLGILFLFKYFDFFGASVVSLLNAAHIPYAFQSLSLVLPIGISFYTFQQISYSVDIYQGRLQPERNFGIYALFVAFFPHITSGPIDRGISLLPQFHKIMNFDSARTIDGLRLILWGVFKKTIIADRLSVYVDAVYQNPYRYDGLSLMVATLFFAFQIYADFSAYTNIALGIAKILGFDLAINFRQPYLSTSIREFWQRWHMSLSNWIRDYLFSPLARHVIRITKGKYTRAAQLIVSVVVMGLVGLWHGASWTFILWGLLHGLFLGLEALWRNISLRSGAKAVDSPQQRIYKILTTFTLVYLTWIFFRANTIDDAFYIVTHLFAWNITTFRSLLSVIGISGLVTCLLLILMLIVTDVLDERFDSIQLLNRVPRPVRWALYYAAIFSILQYGVISAPQFIYARF